ncbi:hypothetical protein VOA_001968 [Vibrio sp. RC586]|nr:hypothetical protein VOA_001968 [Vibrio sp. RC586]
MKVKCINQEVHNQVMRSAFFHQDESCPPSKILLKYRQFFALLMEIIE